MTVKNISTSISEDIIITNLTGFITLADVNSWFNSFEKTCYSFIRQEKKYKLLVNRKEIILQNIFLYKNCGKTNFSLIKY